MAVILTYRAQDDIDDIMRFYLRAKSQNIAIKKVAAILKELDNIDQERWMAQTTQVRGLSKWLIKFNKIEQWLVYFERLPNQDIAVYRVYPALKGGLEPKDIF